MDSRKMGQYRRKLQPTPHGTCKSPPPPFEATLMRAKMHYQQYRNIPPSSSLSLDDQHLPSKLRLRKSTSSNNPFIKDDDDDEVQTHCHDDNKGNVNNNSAISTDLDLLADHPSNPFATPPFSSEKLSDDGGVGPEALEDTDSSSESKSSTQKSPEDSPKGKTTLRGGNYVFGYSVRRANFPRATPAAGNDDGHLSMGDHMNCSGQDSSSMEGKDCEIECGYESEPTKPPSNMKSFHPIKEVKKNGHQILDSDDVGRGSQIPAVEDGGVKVKRVSFQNSASKKDTMEARAMAIQEAKWTKALSKLRREEELIDAWKNEEEAKAETQKKRIEKRLDKLRAKEMEKIQKKMDEAFKKAEEKKAAERAKVEAEASSMKTAFRKLLSAKKLPWSLFQACSCYKFKKPDIIA